MQDAADFAAQLPGLAQVDAASVLASVQARWPQLNCDATAFGRFVAARLVTGAEVRQLHLADLYLVWATLEGQRPALRSFDALLVEWTSAALRARPAGVEVADVQGVLRERLLVGGPGGAAALMRYAGQGALKAYVIVAALRALTDVLRRTAPTQHLGALELAHTMLDEAHDPGALAEATQLRPYLREALEQSVAQLPIRLRTVLRLHYLEGIPAEALARMYNVHRATTTRWLTEARQRVLEATRGQLAEVMGTETFSSVRRELGDFELSVAGLLAASPGNA
ncbi:MAG: sigma-70 family RNA polymerase sigma factor, partial [Archangium sp.]